MHILIPALIVIGTAALFALLFVYGSVR